MPMRKIEGKERSRRLLLTGSLVLAGLFSVMGAQAAYSQDIPRITDVDATRESISLQVEAGFFDPILKLEPPGRNGLYQIVIEGESVTVSPDLNMDKLLKEISQEIPAVQGLHLLRLKSESGEPAIRLILESRSAIQPQLQANLGNEIRISLISGKLASAATPVVTSQPESVPVSKSVAIASDPVPVSPPSVALAAGAMMMADPTLQSGLSDATYQTLQVGEPALDEAFALIRGGQPKEAERVLKTYLDTKPKGANQAWAKLLLGAAALERKESQSAARIWRELISEHRGFLPAYQRLIGLHMENRAYTDAELLLSLGFSNWPNDSVLNFQRGLLSEIRNEPDEAVLYYGKILRTDPENPTYHYRMALVELKRKNLPAARYELNRALALSPDDTRLHKMLGYVYTLDKNPDLALAAYAKALSPDVMLNYARLLAGKKQVTQAVSIYEAVETIAPDNADLLFNLGMLYAEINQKQAAERTLHKFLTLRRGQTDKRIEQAESTLKKLVPAG